MCPHFKCSSSRYNIYITNGREVNNRGILGGKDGESREQTLHKIACDFLFFLCLHLDLCLYLWDEGINVCFDASGFVYVTCQGKVCVGD